MSMRMHVNIASAEAEIFSGTVARLFAPAMLGEIGIYPRHTQLLSQLRPGEVRLVSPSGKEESFFVSGGIIEVQPHTVTVLADTAVRAKDLDEAQAMEAKSRAEKALRDRSDGVDPAYAEAELAEAIAQLQTIQRMRRKYSGQRN